MSVDVLMPTLSPTMTEGKLSKWLVQVGDIVQAGDIIAEIETDKATMEVEASDGGTIAKIIVEAGGKAVAVGGLIAIIAEKGENLSDIGKPVVKPAAAVINSPVNNSISNSPAQQRSVGQGNPGSNIEVAATNTQVLVDELPSGDTVNISLRDALRDAIAEEMRNDESVFLLGEEVAQYHGAYKVSQGLLEEFGEGRIIDTPITESGFTGLAIGAAMAGLKPIVEFMTFNFAMQAIDHIVNSAAKTLYMSGGKIKVPIVFRGPNGAASRVAAQHSQCFASWYAHIPGIKVIAPYSAADAKGLLKSAIRDPNPVVFLEHEMLYGKTFEVPVAEYTIPIGKARIVKIGSDVTIIAFSIGVSLAIAAAQILAKENISAEIIDLRTLRPLDSETIMHSIRKTNRAVTIEEGWAFAGIGAEIAAQIMTDAFDWLDAPVIRITGKDVPMPYAVNLEKLALPSVDEIVLAAKAVLYRQ